MTLVVRHHSDSNAESEAVYSACEAYRYSLTRVWEISRKRLLYIMLNPSKATELVNDPTIERCQRRALNLGYGAMRICNIFAWRATAPKDLKVVEDPVGADNENTLLEGLEWADDTLCAWGVHGSHLGRGNSAARLLCTDDTEVRVLGLTRDGHPRHPLYVGYSQTPVAWESSKLQDYILRAN